MRFKHINSIMHKELRGYFNSPLAYIFITVFLVVSSWLFFNGFFLNNQATMRGFFTFLPWFFLLLLPALTMRLWAEERKMGTMEVLLTAPVTPWEAVLGKFFASFSFFMIALLLSLILPVILFFIGDPDWGAIVGGYFGTCFLAASYLVIGLWISSFTDNQIIAFILSVLLIFILMMIGQDFVLYTVPQELVPVLKYIGLTGHYQSITRGVLDSRDVVYYVLFIFLFLYLNVASLKNQRWH